MVHGVVEGLATIEEMDSDESTSSLNNDKVEIKVIANWKIRIFRTKY